MRSKIRSGAASNQNPPPAFWAVQIHPSRAFQQGFFGIPSHIRSGIANSINYSLFGFPSWGCHGLKTSREFWGWSRVYPEFCLSPLEFIPAPGNLGEPLEPAPVGSEGVRGGLEAPGRSEKPQIQRDSTPGPAFHMDHPQRAEFQRDWDPSQREAPNPTGRG